MAGSRVMSMPDLELTAIGGKGDFLIARISFSQVAKQISFMGALMCRRHLALKT
jgi:hypothetical protein